jgi:4a-hydroxytetrahydrobiopterin dehydratase
MEFANEVAKIADEEDHHPDILVRYNKVKLDLWTHAANGLTENDFIVAAKVDAIISK